MKKEYDFSNGIRGKFYNKKAQLNLPIYLDKDLQELKKTIKDAILFEGFAHVDVKQSCPSWEKR